MQASCPLCDDYTGAVASVEAHITAATDPAHKGERGRDHTDDILPGEVDREPAEPASEPAEEEPAEPESAPPYDCGNCGHSLTYGGGEDTGDGGKRCPNCGKRLLWDEVGRVDD